MKKRIWELDAFRGICIIAVVIVHLIFDMVELYRIIDLDYPAWFYFLKQWGGTVFLVLSGICVTLGSRSVRRGSIVFGAGMLCTAVTYAMTYMGFTHHIIIHFGVLHCLGVCMLLWPLLKKLPWWGLAVLGALVVAVGLGIMNVRVESRWLVPFGFVYPEFSSSDYFPLLPNMGFFLVGAAIGKTVYRNKESLLPRLEECPAVRPLCFCGRQSLWIYLLHQPVVVGICYLIFWRLNQ